MTTVPAQQSLPSVSRSRRIAFVVLAALLAIFTGLIMGGVSALVATFTATGVEVIHQAHFLHWGAFMVVLTAVPPGDAGGTTDRRGRPATDDRHRVVPGRGRGSTDVRT